MKFFAVPDAGFGAYFVFAKSAPTPQEPEEGISTATFLTKNLVVKPLKTGIFQRDLTSRDDILIAVLSLLLLLTLHAILTSIILRSSSGAISTFAFSVAHFLQLVRNFRAFRKRRSSSALNVKLAVIAVLVVTLSFGLEILILFLSEPGLVPVTNHDASFTLKQLRAPRWPDVVRASSSGSSGTTTSPCTTLRLDGVEQRMTKITTCLTAVPLSAASSRRFEKVADEEETVELKIVTELHEYGAKHCVRIGEVDANFSARAYVTLGDGKARLVPERVFRVVKDNQVKILHNNLIAYTAAKYNADTGTNRFTLELLEGLKPKLNMSSGSDVGLLKVSKGEKYYRVTSYRYETLVKKMPAVGSEAVLSLANLVFKAATTVKIGTPSETDLMIRHAIRNQQEAVMWYEESRLLNWLTLSLLGGGSAVALVIVRWGLKPTSTAEMAAVLVEKCAEEEVDVSALENWARADWDRDVARGYRKGREKEYAI